MRSANVCVLVCPLVLWTCGFAPWGLTATATGRPRDAIDGIAGLQKPVTFTETKIALGELVERVATDTGVALGAATDVADEPVTVVVNEMPARQLLEELASLLDYRWRQRGSERESGREENGRRQRPKPREHSPEARHATPFCEIYQDVGARQREEALRQSARDRVARMLQQEIRGAIEMAALPTDTLQTIVKEGESLRWRSARTADEARRKQRLLLAEQMLSPVSRELARMLERLSSAQWAQLGVRGELAFSSDPRAGELPLPTGMIDLFRASQPSMAYPIRRSSSPEHNSFMERANRERDVVQRQIWQRATGYRILVELDWSSLERASGSLALHAAVTIPPGNLPVEVTGPYGMKFRPLVFLGGAGTQISLSANPRDAQQKTDEQTRHRQEFEKDPALGTLRGFQPASVPGISSIYAGLWWLRELLPELARIYDVDFIADAYWLSAPVFAREVTREPAALYRILDRTAGPLQQWDRRGRLIRMRSRTWFFDRPREVPLRLVRRWQSVCREHGALPIAEWRDLLGALNQEQLETMPDILMQTELPSEMGRAPAARYLIRFEATLSAAQREALRQGTALRVEQLSAMQRDLLGLALLDANRHYGLTPTAASVTEGSLTLVQQPQTRVIQRLAGRSRYLDEAPTAPVARPAAPLPGGTALMPPMPGTEPTKRHAIIALHMEARQEDKTLRTAAITIAQP
jgi:hypothetical protein